MQSICLCVSSKDKCMHNPMFYIIKRKICQFKICSIFSLCRSVLNSCFLDAGTLSRIVYTYESVVMYAIVLIG